MEVAEIRVRGRVQGVGFRPAVWRLAHELGLSGEVRNDADGVLIRVAGDGDAIAALLDRIRDESPPLARIDRIERQSGTGVCTPGFRIAASAPGAARTEITPDAAVCTGCAREVLDPAQRRNGYGFTNCTHCGPRFGIIRAIPYDRAATTMAPFHLCAACRHEYQDPTDRRFHAEAIACPDCGPQVSLGPGPSGGDPIDAATAVLRGGGILAVKGLGGYQLACDATNAAAVIRLRLAKRRERKPFALMARDLAVIRRYASVDVAEELALTAAEAPIVLLPAGTEKRMPLSSSFPRKREPRSRGTLPPAWVPAFAGMAGGGDADEALPDAVAPGVATLGFMLPTTPLHLLLLRAFDRPVVMTSGNLTDSPQIIDDAEALDILGGIADAVLTHDRAIATRVDDSIVRVMAGVPRVQRRGRGFAPAATTLPAEFAASPDLLAMGGELKAAFCLVKDGAAILSQHIGDLEDARTFDDYRRGIAHYATLFGHAPVAVAVDQHPDYLSSKYARELQLRVIEVQHHHAHVAACLAENGRPLDAPPVLGIVLDGLGWGDDGTIWGGEFLLADYRSGRRLAAFRPVAMPGGAAAVREPWRNLYAHLVAAGLEPPVRHSLLDGLIRNRVNAPLASSCGRLFDAVAAALGICAERQMHEGEAASRLEAIVCPRTLHQEEDALAYSMTVPRPASFPRKREPEGRSMDATHQGPRFRGDDESGVAWLDPRPMWPTLLRDIQRCTPHGVIAARFHKGLAISVVTMAQALCGRHDFGTVALSGGCFQNAVLFEQTEHRLRDAGFAVLTHRMVPPNDGGLAFGQAAIAAARLIG